LEKTERGERRNNKEMDKKILVSMMVIGLVATLAGAGLYAYFSDTETSSGNYFRAGTLDLQLKDPDEDWRNGVSASIVFSNMLPGVYYGGAAEVIGPAWIKLKNVGTVDAGGLDITVSYVESDGDVTAPDGTGTNDVDADTFAKALEVKELCYGPSYSDFFDIIGAGKIDDSKDGKTGFYSLYDVVHSSPIYLGGITSGGEKIFWVAVRLDSAVVDNFQGEGVAVTFTFLLKQT
jgi:predicted ribosomally synthesized peptide with SipW-like signal peptide